VGDYLEIKRLERCWRTSTRRLKERGIKNPEPNVNLALPILAAAADETREELQNIWEGLLAAAMDPQRQNFVRQVLITTVKAMDPLDALVFNIIAKKGAAAWTEPGRNYIASQLGVSFDEVTVSFDNLANLNLVTFGPGPRIDPNMAPLGNLLMKAIA
jgi:Abortive infection alpha